jgi:hypothetical protein
MIIIFNINFYMIFQYFDIYTLFEIFCLMINHLFNNKFLTLFFIIEKIRLISNIV